MKHIMAVTKEDGTLGTEERTCSEISQLFNQVCRQVAKLSAENEALRKRLRAIGAES